MLIADEMVRAAPWQREVELSYRAGYRHGADTLLAGPDDLDGLIEAAARARIELRRRPQPGLPYTWSPAAIGAWLRGYEHGLRAGSVLLGRPDDLSRWQERVADWASGDPDFAEPPPQTGGEAG